MGNEAPNKSEFYFIEKKLGTSNISQIIFDFNIDIVRCIVKYYESIEDYEFCFIIKSRLTIHNRITGKNFKI